MSTDKLKEDGAPRDMTDDPAYQSWVESMAKYCRCKSSDVPCAGVLAGGLCDEIDDSADQWDEDDFEISPTTATPNDRTAREGDK